MVKHVLVIPMSNLAARTLPGASVKRGFVMETVIVKIILMKRTVNHWCANLHLTPVPTTLPSACPQRSFVMGTMTVEMVLMRETYVISAL